MTPTSAPQPSQTPPTTPASAIRLAPHQLWLGVRKTLRSDVFGGALLLAATVAAVILANSPAVDAYERLRDFAVGPEVLHLHLTVGAWASDGLLAVFFFVVGLELKEEFVVGRLRDPRKAVLPIVAACGGVIAPALLFVLLNHAGGPDALRGWAVPTATDIAFSAAVLAVVGRTLPGSLRVFLLTLAIVDDLIAIVIIATVYTGDVRLLWLALALVPLGGFGVLVQRGVRSWWLLMPLAICVWALVHASGIHATIAGVLLAATVPVVATPRARVRVGDDDDGPVYDGLAPYLADRWGTFSESVAVPVFAFFAAGVAIGGVDGLRSAFSNPITVGIVVGLVLGKPLGIVGTTFLLTRFRSLNLDPALRWPDMLGMAFVAGIGFTVSLLVGELAFGGTAVSDDMKIGVLAGSLVAAVIGSAILAGRNRRVRELQRPAAMRDQTEVTDTAK